MIPSDFGLPHETFRKYQLETIQWALGIKTVGVLEAPTGSGKTATACAASSRKSVIALCETKFLQESTYSNDYGFAAIYGRGNYLCAHPKGRGLTCAECLFADEGMRKCPYACPYLVAKARAIASPKASLNYPYWLTSKGWRTNHAPAMLILDEAHRVPDIITGWTGASITDKHRLDWQLPTFPRITAQGKGMFVNTDNDPVADAIGWLEAARTTLGQHCTRLKREAKGDTESARKARKRLMKCERLGHKLRTTLDALKSSPDDWFIRSGRDALQFGKDKRPGFVAKPLTARHHFKDYFLDGYTTLMMSATIGDAGTFAAECGVKEYDSRVVPHRFAPEDRLVLSLDVSGMGRKATNADFEHQADAIARAVKSVDSAWSGLVLVSRKREARLLADRLAHRGLQDRIFVPPGWGNETTATNKQLQAWENRKRQTPNSLCVTWAFWQGFDGRDERICIVAKAPFPFIGSAFERARMKYSGKMFLQRTAWGLEQGLGRTRRGRDEDYGPGTGLVAIADRNWRRVRKYLSQATRDAIVED